MRKMLLSILMAALALPAFAADNTAKKEGPPPPTVKVGDTAPDFTLSYFDGTQVKKVSLSDFRGKKNVVLAFYIFAFTPG